MELKHILEVILFSAQKPLSPQELKEILAQAAEQAEEAGPAAFKKVPLEEIRAALELLEQEINASNRTFQLICVAGSWQFASKPDYSPWLKSMFGFRSRPPRLSAPALETLAVIAYRQPVTRAEIEQVRGVAVDGVMQTLLERGLVEQRGRAEVVGRPMTYGTTAQFLEYFGLPRLEDLPAADELRRIPVEKPESLQTIDPAAVPADGEAPAESAPVTSTDPAVEETPAAASPAEESTKS